jgi:DnaJ family protein C protein 16
MVSEIDMSSLSSFLRRREVWIILFHTSTMKERDMIVWKELAEKYTGIFKVASINCSEEEELCSEEFQVYSYPTVLCYPVRSGAEPLKYKGELNVLELSKLAID